MTGMPAQDVSTLEGADADTDGPTMRALLRRAAARDILAWDSLIAQYGRVIWSITTRFKLMESDAADVVQTTWMRLIEHIDQIEQPDRIGSWPASTARNECLRHVAARKRLVLVRENAEFGGADYHGPQVDEALLAAERAQLVREAMAYLPASPRNGATARAADSRPADLLRRDIGSAGIAGG